MIDPKAPPQGRRAAGPRMASPAARVDAPAAMTTPSETPAGGADGPADRQGWMAVLARADRAALDGALDRLGEFGAVPVHRMVRPPETGLVAVEGRIGGTGDRFILGEMTVTRCCVALGEVMGVAYVAGRDHRRAELAALFDALMQQASWREPVRRLLVEPVAAGLAATRRTAARRAAATRVDFTTLVRGS